MPEQGGHSEGRVEVDGGVSGTGDGLFAYEADGRGCVPGLGRPVGFLDGGLDVEGEFLEVTRVGGDGPILGFELIDTGFPKAHLLAEGLHVPVGKPEGDVVPGGEATGLLEELGESG